jgi:3-phenylpropionate/cinnamic acid dioxygenase small subunit
MAGRWGGRLSEQAVANVLSRYARSLDSGDFAALGELFAQGSVRFATTDAVYTGAAAVQHLYEDIVQVRDGRPGTMHVTSNVEVYLESDTSAEAHSYYTVLQATASNPLAVVAAGEYADRLHKSDGSWLFTERVISIHFEGDLSEHLLASPFREPPSVRSTSQPAAR